MAGLVPLPGVVARAAASFVPFIAPSASGTQERAARRELATLGVLEIAGAGAVVIEPDQADRVTTQRRSRRQALLPDTPRAAVTTERGRTGAQEPRDDGGTRAAPPAGGDPPAKKADLPRRRSADGEPGAPAAPPAADPPAAPREPPGASDPPGNGGSPPPGSDRGKPEDPPPGHGKQPSDPGAPASPPAAPPANPPADPGPPSDPGPGDPPGNGGGGGGRP